MKKITFIFTVILFLLSSSVFAQQIRDTIKLKEVIIEDIKVTPYLKSTLSKTAIEKNPTRDIGDLLRAISGVSGIRKGGIAIDPVIRGFKFTQVGVQLDNGIRIEGGCPSRMDPVAAHVEIEDIETINLIKGPYMLRFGPAFGGKVNLVTFTPKPYEKFEIHSMFQSGYESNWNGHKEHLILYGGNKKIYFSILGGYKNYGNYEDGDGNMVNSSFTKYNYGAKIGLDINKKQSLMVSYYEDKGRNVKYPALPMDEKYDDTRIVAIDYKIKEISPLIKAFTLKMYQSDVDHHMDNTKRPEYSAIVQPNTAIMQAYAQADAVNTGGRAEFNLAFKKGDILFIGADYDNVYKNGERTMTMIMNMGGTITTSTSKTNLWKDALVNNGGIFGEYHKKIKSFEFIAALRGDYNTAISEDTLVISKEGIDYFNITSSQFLNVSGSIAVSMTVSKNITLALSAGRGVRSPNMNERYIKFLTVGYDKYDYLGNPLLKPEVNYQADITVNYNSKAIGNTYINAFFAYIDKFITGTLVPSSVAMPKTKGASGVKQFINSDYAIFRGFEFGYNSSTIYNFGFDIIAELTKASVSATTKYILQNNQVVDDTLLKNDPLPEIPPLEFTISAYYNFYNSKLVPKISFRVVADQEYVSDAFYEPYTPGFGLLDFSVKYKINSYVSVFAGVNNIFDRAYYEHLNRKIIGTPGKLYEPGRVFFLNLYVNI